MLARVQTVHGAVEKFNELTKVARAQLPASQELSGFRGLFLLTGRETGTALVISFWDSERDLRSMEARTEDRERLAADAGVSSPPSQVFDVAIRAC